MACSRARNLSKSPLPISMGRTAKLNESLAANHVARKRRGPLAVTGVSDLHIVDAIIRLHCFRRIS